MAHFRKERKEIKVEKSEFRIQRLSMKVVSIMSLIIGGLIPILFWTQNNVSPTNPLNQNEAILFIWLIFVAIINITF